MNLFFRPHEDVRFEPPPMAYGRVDDVESGLEDDLLISLSAVNASWFDEYPGVREYKPEKFGRESSWARFWADRFRYSGTGSPNFPVTDPFYEMPLFQYEISVPGNGHGRSKFLDVAADDSTWVRISNDPAGELRAHVYGSLFGPPISQNVSISPVSDAKTSVLNAAFDMDHWPDAADEDIEDALRSNRQASYLAAFDIGQGSASAILDELEIPWLYHDLGAGVYRNSGTTPTPLKFCFTHRPPVVLSHWDADHWAGAGHDARALLRTWVAPRQSIGPTHAAFQSALATTKSKEIAEAMRKPVPPRFERLDLG